jgi:osmoprotectant transport system permease protein
VHFLAHVWGWFTTSANWTGPTGVPELLWQTAKLSLAVVTTAVVVGGGIGSFAGHTGRGSIVAVNAANAARAIPTLALLSLFVIVPSISIKWGGFLAAYLALVVLAVPPILTNTFAGVRSVDADARDAARGMGLTGWQTFAQVEAPLAFPFVMAGIRTATVEVVATSTLAAYVSYTDLGTPVFSGLSAPNDPVALAGAFAGSLLVALLAGIVAIALGGVQRAVTPAPLRRTRAGGLVTGAGRFRTAVD